MNRRLLIVSPHFPPVSAADMHRVRLLAPLLAHHGWDVHILSVAPGDTLQGLDPRLATPGIAALPVTRVPAPTAAFARLPGLGTLGIRAWRAMARAGDALLRERPFDLVYFSTTMFELHMLGPRWRARYGTRFVMDYQDAWVSDYYRENPAARPPGGRAKYALASALHRWMEPRVLRACSGLTSVSAAYPAALDARYGALRLPTLVQPFPGAASDITEVADIAAPMPWMPDDGHLHWVYVGRGGDDMARALRGLFRAIAEHAPPALRARLRLHFIGTSYASGGAARHTVSPLAAEYGLADIVREHPGRVPYSQALGLLARADALIVPGSDDPAYTASKIYPYLLSGRPLLAVFDARSSVVDLMERAGGGTAVGMQPGMDEAVLAQAIGERWLEAEVHRRVVPLDAQAFAPFTDAACAAELAAFLHQVAEAGTP